MTSYDVTHVISSSLTIIITHQGGPFPEHTGISEEQVKAHLYQQFQEQCQGQSSLEASLEQGQNEREREEGGGLRAEEVMALRQAWVAYEANNSGNSTNNSNSNSNNNSSNSSNNNEQERGEQERGDEERETERERERERETEREREREREEGGRRNRMPVSALSQVSCYGDSASQKLLAVKLIRTDITHVEVSDVYLRNRV